MIFVRQNNSTGIHIGPILLLGDDQTVLIGSSDLSTYTCYYVKGTSIQGTITLVEGSNISSITSSSYPFMNFNPGASYFDTTGPVSFCFIKNSTTIVHTVDCFVLAPETYDLLFASTGDTLGEIIENSLLPNVVGASSLSGTGFLSSSVSKIRQIIEEPSVNVKYSDSDILGYLKGSIGSVLTDVNANTDHPVLVRWSMPIVVDKQSYTLPPHCQKLYRIAKVNSIDGTVEWEVLPGSRWDWGNYGFRIEGNTIRLLAKWQTAYTVQVDFVPNSETYSHLATTATYTANTVTLPASVTDGTLDTRPDSYCGYLFRVLSSTDSGAVYTQERRVISHNNQTRVITVDEDFSPALAGTITYELVPSFSYLLQEVFCFHTAMTILGIEGAAKKYGLVKDIYNERKRALRQQLRKEFRVGQVFEGQTTTNQRFRNWGRWA